MRHEPFGRALDGSPVHQITLERGGMRARILDWGGTVRTLEVPDPDGPVDVVLGFDDLTGYLGQHPYFGVLVGRYANRLAGGRFQLEGAAYEVPPNDGPNALHGGTRGFDKHVWEVVDVTADALGLRRVSPDREMGFPGALTVEVRYALTGAGTFRIVYRATSDAPTVLNLTNHAYFDLGGRGDVRNHELTVRASRFTPVGPDRIPTGELRQVEGTAFDLRGPTVLAERLGADDDQIRIGGGFDHNFAIDGVAGELRLAATVRDPVSNRRLEVWTDQPGVQLYTGNLLDGTLRGKGGRPYRRHAGLCLETQHFPDAPNQPGFPSTVLRPGEAFRSVTEYRFG